MKKKAVEFRLKSIFVAFLLGIGAVSTDAQIDTTRVNHLEEVVVTGVRYETDVRHLPMTVSVVGRKQIEQSHNPSLLPLLTEQVPGMFVTSHGVMGNGDTESTHHRVH